MTLYHGSDSIIASPVFGKGNVHNDYGLGFYCTQSTDLAKEWACSNPNGGYANQYDFDATGLTTLNLADGTFHILNWLAILLENRTFRMSNLAEDAKRYILENFLVEYKPYDMIIGYRADDSYFSFATAFLNNTISLQKLEKAMVLGKLGLQIVLKSPSAFERLRFVEAKAVDGAVFYPKRLARDEKAREEFRTMREKTDRLRETYMLDILRERWENDDARLQRVIPG